MDSISMKATASVPSDSQKGKKYPSRKNSISDLMKKDVMIEHPSGRVDKVRGQYSDEIRAERRETKPAYKPKKKKFK